MRGGSFTEIRDTNVQVRILPGVLARTKQLVNEIVLVGLSTTLSTHTAYFLTGDPMLIDALTMIIRIVLILFLLSAITSGVLIGWVFISEFRRYFRSEREVEIYYVD
jgi:hypothetical protein